jgi:uncharacterized protein YutE (UPF0331/DUF86 family)
LCCGRYDKKIAEKNSVASSGKTLDPIIDDLAKASVISPVETKRLKSYAETRNSVLHARWEEFDIRDIGYLIKGTRELIEHFL